MLESALLGLFMIAVSIKFGLMISEIDDLKNRIEKLEKRK